MNSLKLEHLKLLLSIKSLQALCVILLTLSCASSITGIDFNKILMLDMWALYRNNYLVPILLVSIVFYTLFHVGLKLIIRAYIGLYVFPSIEKYYRSLPPFERRAYFIWKHQYFKRISRHVMLMNHFGKHVLYKKISRITMDRRFKSKMDNIYGWTCILLHGIVTMWLILDWGIVAKISLTLITLVLCLLRPILTYVMAHPSELLVIINKSRRELLQASI